VGKRKGRNNLLHTVDSKGRVSIPIHIRRTLHYGETIVLTKGLDPCIYAFTSQEWEKIQSLFEKKLEEKPLGRKRDRDLIRKVMGEAEEIEIDPQGRIRIPGHLAEYAGIDSICFFVKMPSWFEIWNPDRYRETMKEVDEIKELEGIHDKD
jgi:MraZ protein